MLIIDLCARYHHTCLLEIILAPTIPEVGLMNMVDVFDYAEA